MYKLHIILGSTRDGRKGEAIAQWVYEQVKSLKNVEATLLDLRDFPMPFYDEAGPAAMLNGKYKSEVASRWVSKIKEADGYIIVTPEYNNAYPAVLKNAMDYPYSEWNNKPVAFVSYGYSANGTRAVQQLRQIVIELQMAPIRESVNLSLAQELFDQKGNIINQSHSKKLHAMLEQLLWWTKTLKAGRENDTNE